MTRLAHTGRTRISERVAKAIDRYFENVHPKIETFWSGYVAGEKGKSSMLFPADPGERNVIASTIHSAWMLGGWYSGVGGILGFGTLRTLWNVASDDKHQALWQIMQDSYVKTAYAVLDFWRDTISYAVDHPKMVAAIYLTGKVIGKIAHEREVRKILISQVAGLTSELEKLRKDKAEILDAPDQLCAAADKGIAIGDLKKMIIDRELLVRITKAGNNRPESERLSAIREDFEHLRIDCNVAGTRLDININQMTLEEIIKNIDDSIAACTRSIDATTARINLSGYAAFGMRKFAIAMNIVHMNDVIEAVSNAYSAPDMTKDHLIALLSSMRYAGASWVIGKIQKAAERAERAFSIPRGVLALNIFYAPQIYEAIKNWVHSDNTFFENLQNTASSLRFLIAAIAVKIGISVYNRYKKADMTS